MARWPDATVKRGDLLYMPATRHLSCRDRAVVLRPAAAVVLRQLMQPGTAVTRYEAFLAALEPLPPGGCGTMSTLRAAVFALRHHLRALGSQASIRVSSRIGYRLIAGGVAAGLLRRARPAAGPAGRSGAAASGSRQAVDAERVGTEVRTWWT